MAAAVITGILGVVGISAQISAENARSSSEFVRDQRQDVYARFITAGNELRRVEDEFLLMLAGGRPPAEVTTQRVRLDEAYSKLQVTVSNALLVGSAQISVAAMNIESAHRIIRGLAFGIEVGLSHGALDDELRESYSDNLNDRLSKVAGLLSEFTSSARADLGTPL